MTYIYLYTCMVISFVTTHFHVCRERDGPCEYWTIVIVLELVVEEDEEEAFPLLHTYIHINFFIFIIFTASRFAGRYSYRPVNANNSFFYYLYSFLRIIAEFLYHPVCFRCSATLLLIYNIPKILCADVCEQISPYNVYYLFRWRKFLFKI